MQELIRARTKALSDDVRRVLAAAAVLGRPFDTRLLRTIGGQTEPELIQVLDQLVKKGFLRERDAPFPEPALDFQHEYIRQSIYEQLGAIQRRALHRRAAEALLAHYRARPDRIIEEVAFHFELAEESRAIPHLVQAAKQAAGLFAFGHAVDLYTRALEALRVHFPDQLDRQFELLLARESVFDSQGRRAKQAEDLAALAELAKNTSDRGLEAEARVRQAGFLAYTGKFEAARRAGEAALDLYRAIGNRDGEAQAMRELGFIHWREEDFGTALNY
ncbi:MAG: hypothetical protein GTO62_07585, partial [Planctomycetales bacterium]|nr:hypothetical protein [Planctomycetales bacterium]